MSSYLIKAVLALHAAVKTHDLTMFQRKQILRFLLNFVICSRNVNMNNNGTN